MTVWNTVDLLTLHQSYMIQLQGFTTWRRKFLVRRGLGWRRFHVPITKHEFDVVRCFAPLRLKPRKLKLWTEDRDWSKIETIAPFIHKP